MNADSSPTSTVHLVTFRPAGQLIAGAIARHSSLKLHYESQGIAVAESPLRGETRATGRLSRLASVGLGLLRIRRRVVKDDLVHVEGLSTPESLMVAAAFKWSGSNVKFDACDSWSLLGDMQLATKQRRIFHLTGTLQRVLLGRSTITYVSSRDSERDQASGYALNVEVIANRPNPVLENLPQFNTGTGERFAVSGLYSSPHLASGLTAFATAWRGYVRGASEGLPLDIYGTPRAAVPNLPKSRFIGYSSSIEDLYAGRTIVIVLNSRGSGVPNKLLEAVSCQRPIVLHADLAEVLRPHPMIFLWRDPETFRVALESSAIAEWNFEAPLEWR